MPLRPTATDRLPACPARMGPGPSQIPWQGVSEAPWRVRRRGALAAARNSLIGSSCLVGRPGRAHFPRTNLNLKLFGLAISAAALALAESPQLSLPAWVSSAAPGPAGATGTTSNFGPAAGPARCRRPQRTLGLPPGRLSAGVAQRGLSLLVTNYHSESLVRPGLWRGWCADSETDATRRRGRAGPCRSRWLSFTIWRHWHRLPIRLWSCESSHGLTHPPRPRPLNQVCRTFPCSPVMGLSTAGLRLLARPAAVGPVGPGDAIGLAAGSRAVSSSTVSQPSRSSPSLRQDSLRPVSRGPLRWTDAPGRGPDWARK